jgi:HAD superfamily, subfamily IIIB (Acid phosphatase)
MRLRLKKKVSQCLRVCNMKQAWLVDLDSTLSDPKHRLHYVKTNPKNFSAFEAECHHDEPIKPVEKVVRALYNHGFYILIVSARMDDRRYLTEGWLAKHNIPHHALYMRKAKDTRKDDIVKKEILDKILSEGYSIVGAFDDRKRVKRMWVENGIFVFDVNQKDLNY